MRFALRGLRPQQVQAQAQTRSIGYLKWASAAGVPRLLKATLCKREPLPRGFRLFKVRQSLASPTSTLDATKTEDIEAAFIGGTIKGVHHVALICESLERSLHFYVDILGLTINPNRPSERLPYRGAWLNIGPEMIHLMELPNPDKLGDRPEHGGRDRHFCIGIEEGSLDALMEKLSAEGIPYTLSRSGRSAIFFRDPDENCLEAVEISDWRL